MNSKEKIKVRFAPSPTGYFHIGSAYISIINFFLYLSSYKKNKDSSFLLRIDDTDIKRSFDKYITDICNSLKYLNIKYDNIFKQSERIERYREIILMLLKKDWAYICCCYKKKCICKKDQTSSLKDHLVRINMNKFHSIFNIKKIYIPDLITKNIWLNIDNTEDFVIFRQGMPVYFLASIIDDIDYNITHIIRGQEWINSSHKYLILKKILSKILNKNIVFNFIHISSIFDPKTNKKLSKRTLQNLSICDLIEQKYHPTSIIFYLIQLGFNIKIPEGFVVNLNNVNNFLIKLQNDFNIKHIKLRNPFLDLKKLNYINMRISNTLNIADFKKYIFDHLSSSNLLDLDQTFSIYNNIHFTIQNINEGIEYLDQLGIKNHFYHLNHEWFRENKSYLLFILSFLSDKEELLDILNIKLNKIKIFKCIRKIFINKNKGLPIYLILKFNINIKNDISKFRKIINTIILNLS